MFTGRAAVGINNRMARCRPHCERPRCGGADSRRACCAWIDSSHITWFPGSYVGAGALMDSVHVMPERAHLVRGTSTVWRPYSVSKNGIPFDIPDVCDDGAPRDLQGASHRHGQMPSASGWTCDGIGHPKVLPDDPHGIGAGSGAVLTTWERRLVVSTAQQCDCVGDHPSAADDVAERTPNL